MEQIFQKCLIKIVVANQWSIFYQNLSANDYITLYKFSAPSVLIFLKNILDVRVIFILFMHLLFVFISRNILLFIWFTCVRIISLIYVIA